MAAASDAANGQVFNVGSGVPISLKDAADRVVRIAGSGSVTSVPFPADKKKIEVGNYCADCSKIRRALGWEARVPFEEGLERTIEFYRKHKLHYWEED